MHRYPIVLSLILVIIHSPACENSVDEVTHSGQSSAGETAAGETDAGETSAGETAAGETSAGETAAGETAAGETAAGETAAGETAAGETTAGESIDLVQDCNTYCSQMASNCPNVYPDTETCQTQCREFPVVGEPGAREGNSLECRLYHSSANLTDEEDHCINASASGGGVCGSYCEVYCSQMSLHCSDVYSNTYRDQDECLSTCELLPTDGSDGDLMGDSIQCRVYHSGLPALTHPSLHCPAASFLGGDERLTCVDEVSAGGTFSRIGLSSFSNAFNFNINRRSAYHIYYSNSNECLDNSSDLLITVYDSNGEVVAASNSLGYYLSFCSELYFTIEPGTYQIVVSHFMATPRPYQIHIERLPDLMSDELCIDNNELLGNCPPTDFCNIFDFSAYCTPYPQLGETCYPYASEEDLCQGESYCTNIMGNGPICEPLPREGEPCDYYYDRCQNNYYCTNISGQGDICEPVPQAGEPCDYNYDRCQGDHYCTNLQGFGSICEPFPNEGEPCDSSNDHCQGGTYCSDDLSSGQICRVIPRTGDPCDIYADLCLNSECVDGLCVGVSENEGDLCTFSYGCLGELECAIEPGFDRGQCITPRCGDGFVSTNLGESCDDGNNNANDGCSPICRFENSASVTSTPFRVHFYGEITFEDHEWNRPEEDCVSSIPSDESYHYDTYSFTNNSPEDLEILMIANFRQYMDGYLFVYDQEPDDSQWTTGCLIGNDDLNNMRYGNNKSGLKVRITAGSTVYIVISTYSPYHFGTYEVELTQINSLAEGDSCIPEFPEECGVNNLCYEFEGEFTCLTRPLLGEVCDPINDICLDSYCNQLGICTEIICGDGIVSEGELCDDGNSIDDDGCDSLCQYQTQTSFSIESSDSVNITQYGSLDATDRVWYRPESSCYVGFTSVYADVYTLVNNTNVRLYLEVYLEGGFDEYLHLYRSMDIDRLSNCIAGDDDTGSGSLVTTQLAAGQSTYIVVSSYNTLETGPYTLRVRDAVP